MNVVACFRIPALSIALLHCGFAGEKEDFEKLLKEAARPWGLDSRQESKWFEWSGLDTLSGFQLATENILENDDLSRRELGYFAFRNSRVPKSELVAYLMETIDQASEHGDMKRLEKGFKLLSDVGGDSSVVAHWAKYFADDRIIETRPRHREAYYGEPLRVSDTACGVAKGWLKRQGLWDPADPDCHEDPGGYMMWEGRDNTKEALNRFLLKKGLIEKAEQPSRRKWEHDYSTTSATDPAPAKVEPVRPRKDWQTPVAADRTKGMPRAWPWLVAAVALLGWAMLRYLRRRTAR